MVINFISIFKTGFLGIVIDEFLFARHVINILFLRFMYKFGFAEVCSPYRAFRIW